MSLSTSAKIWIKKLVPEAQVPKNANLLDTGYDLVSISEPEIVGNKLPNGYWGSIDYIQYKTGLQISPRYSKYTAGTMQDCVLEEKVYSVFYTLLFPRSSVSKYNLILANSVGVVDNPYRGEIMLRFKYLFQPEDYILDTTFGITQLFGTVNQKKIYQRGDKIGQIAAFELNKINFEEVESLDETVRGDGGFGSTGK
jgi:dUTPase